MRKQTPADVPGESDAAAAAASIEVADEAASEGEQHFDPKREWPAAGGCYVRQEDGTLKHED